MSSTISTKRKRAQISYAEPEDELFDSEFEFDENASVNDIDDDLPEGDTIYGSRKVSCAFDVASTELMGLIRRKQNQCNERSFGLRMQSQRSLPNHSHSCHFHQSSETGSMS